MTLQIYMFFNTYAIKHTLRFGKINVKLTMEYYT